MPYTTQSFYPASVRAADIQTIIPADTTTIKNLSTAGVNGSRIEGINISSTETASAHDVAIYMTVSAVNYLMSTINVPVNAGFISSISAVDVLRSSVISSLQFDSCGNKFLLLPPGASLAVAVNVAVNTGKVLTFVAWGENF